MISRRDFSKTVLVAGASLLATRDALAAHPVASTPASGEKAPAVPAKPRVTNIRGLIHTPPHRTPLTTALILRRFRR
jgi:hypothetical protein